MPELRKFAIAGYFERIVFSSDMGASKPNPKIFDAVLAPMGLEPSQAIFVGDNLFDDIWGAQHMGMTTVWIDRDGGERFPKGLLRPTPDIHVRQRQQGA